MASMKYDLPLLDRDTRFTLWQVKMRALLAQADYDVENWIVLGRTELRTGLLRRKELIVRLCHKFNSICIIIFCRKF